MRVAFPSDPKSRRNLFAGVSVVVLLAASGSLFAISRDTKPKPSETIVYELAPTDILIVRPQTLTRTLRVSGSLTAVRHAVIKSHSTGTLLDMRVREGDRVRRGALLARIDPRNSQAELASREAALHKAQADLLMATKNRDNSIALLKQKLISQNSFDQTVATYDASVANEQAAIAEAQLAKNALDDTEIRADFDGVVATRTAQMGERVMPDTPLLSIADLSQMQLEALVPVADVPTIKVGQSANFKVDGFGERIFTANVERINPQTDQGSRSLMVYLSVANNDGVLKGGMFADGELVLLQTAPMLAIPHDAVRSFEGTQYVLALEHGAVVKHDIELGETFAASGLTAIQKGITEAAQIIVAPVPALKPGMRATIVASKAAG